jgi:hypothetical protein
VPSPKIGKSGALMMLGQFVGLVLGLVVAGPTDGPVRLRERAQPGSVTHLLIQLKAEGLSKPPVPEGRPAARPLPIKVEGRLDAYEKIAIVDDAGLARVVVRHVGQAAAAINAELRPTTSSLRPDVSLLIAERREGTVQVFSPGGPLTRAELEVVQWPADPLSLPALLPEKAVAVGDRWKVRPEVARSLSGYDALAASTLEATLESLDALKARVKLAGTVQGATLGAEGSVDCQGHFDFDREAERVVRLDLQRMEVRKPGQVEAGLDIRSTLTVERTTAEAPPMLADSALAGVPLAPDPALMMLRFEAPGGKFSLLHDRDWHVFYDDEGQSVLKRLDHGDLVAQCNLAIGPDAGKGRHQDPKQLQEDVRAALGSRFGKFLFAGPMDGPDDGLFRYRLAVRGVVDKVPVLWIYYLLANAEGRQLLATFTLAESRSERFADQDLGIIGSLALPAAGGAGPGAGASGKAR